MDSRYSEFIHQIECEIAVILDFSSGRNRLANEVCTTWIDVEGAFRRAALQAFGLVQHRHHEIPPLLEDAGALGNEILGSGECGQCRSLAH